MPGNVLVTGASGFVGKAIVAELLSRGFSVNALVNQKPLDVAGNIRSFPGGLFDAAALDAGLNGCQAAIHLVGIIMENPKKGITFEKIHFEGTRCVVDAAKRQGVRRFIQMSALGTAANAHSTYHKTKWKADEYVRASGLEWTIFQPSMIHGPDGEFMKMEAKWVRKQAAPYFFMPYFGAGLLGFGGSGKIQPVYVNDVARAFVDAPGNEKTIEKNYGVGGPDVMTWPQMHKTVACAILGKNRLTMPIPAWYAKLLTKIVPASLLPFNYDQVIMSQEDNTCGLSEFERVFSWKPQGFESTLAQYASRL
jgi:uncharacterized protein YbjT (DUF2867 family)